MKTLKTLEEIKDLRSIWTDEAKDFTPWLAQDDNIAILSDELGIDITVDEVESPVGGFSVDILASETGTERKIIIENQLEDTNHDHLGKLITYASGKEAEIIIWLVKHARSEHRKAIEWLNEHTDSKLSFILCEIKLYKIGTSDPAVKFEIIEQPNDWAKAIKTVSAASPLMQARLEYWEAFNNYAFNNTSFSKTFSKRKPSMDHWMSLAIGKSGCQINILQIAKRKELNVEFHIYDDKDLYKSLYEKKNEIEKAFGDKLDWRELPEKKASRIIAACNADLSNKNEWTKQFDWIIDTAISMKNAFSKYI